MPSEPGYPDSGGPGSAAALRALVLCILLLGAPLRGGETRPAEKPERAWPPVLLIDDFENGLANWRNEDSGKLDLVEDAPEGRRALRWTATDDGLGRIVYQNLDRSKIDFSQYDLLRFYVKVSGKPIWCLDPIVHQYPAAYGFTAHYYAVDTLEGFDRWILYAQDLTKWENAWPDTFDPVKQEFSFEIGQMAGAGHTVVCLDRIELVKNTLNVNRSYRGSWAQEADGSQITFFPVRVRNTSDMVQTVRCAPIPESLSKFKCRVPADPLVLPPGKEGDLNVYVSCAADVVRSVPPYYGETLLLRIRADETPGLDLVAELPAGTLPPKLSHPVILSNPQLLADLRRQWRDPELRKAMPGYFRTFVEMGEEALSLEPKYPPIALQGRTSALWTARPCSGSPYRTCP